MSSLKDSPFVFRERLGESGSPVLLLHGWGCDSSTMRPIAERIADQHTVLIPDMPGHGKSGRPPEPWGIPEYSSCLLDVLRKENFLPCAVIAHSFGCRIAAWLASSGEGVFTRMIFTGAAGIRPPMTEEKKKKAEHYQRLKKINTAINRTVVLKPLSNVLWPHILDKYSSPDYRALDDEMKKTFNRVISLDLTDRYPLIQQSTLLIWGENDTETPLWMGKKMEELIPDAGLVLFEGGSHFAFLEQADRFCVIAKHFLLEA